MRKFIISGVIVLAVGLLVPQTVQAQGTTYLSNLDQASTGGLGVGSDSWLAALFVTGTNSGGYALNSIQLGMTGASGNPSGFTVMLYTVVGVAGSLPGSTLGSLSGSSDPATSGIYTYTDDPNITLSTDTPYCIVLTAGTTVANGAYEWSLASANSYNPIDRWAVIGAVSVSDVFDSTDGSSWNLISGPHPQFAIKGTAVPEPGVLCLFTLGGLGFLWHRRKARKV